MGDPFAAVEGVEHHRCPAKLAQRVAELEREVARQANVISTLADENARLTVALRGCDGCEAA